MLGAKEARAGIRAILESFSLCSVNGCDWSRPFLAASVCSANDANHDALDRYPISSALLCTSQLVVGSGKDSLGFPTQHRNYAGRQGDMAERFVAFLHSHVAGAERLA